MRLALMIEGQEGVSWEHWLALAQACEQHGVEALFRSDHYLSPTDPEPRGARRLGGHSRARGADGADRARHARLAGDLPPARGARERLDDGVRDLRRPRLARDGHRLDGGRARGVRLPVPADEGAARASSREQIEAVRGFWGDGPRPHLIVGGSGLSGTIEPAASGPTNTTR